MHRDCTKEDSIGKVHLPSYNINTRPGPESDGHDTNDVTARIQCTSDVHSHALPIASVREAQHMLPQRVAVLNMTCNLFPFLKAIFPIFYTLCLKK